MTQRSQFDHTDEWVQKIHKVLGEFPGYRALHADGRFYRGRFRANDEAKRFTRAAHLQGDEVPITVRFSKGGGDPYAHFSATVGMATRFYLADGRITNLVMLSQKLFIARDAEQFAGLLEAGMPKTPGDAIDRAGLATFFQNNPNAAFAFQLRQQSEAPVSFAHTAFHAVHAFNYINADGVVTPVRVHWQPVAGVRGQALAELAQADVAVLYDELDARLKSDPIRYDLVLEFAEPGDLLNDPTALWPEDRRTLSIGRLEIVRPMAQEETGDPVMNHDPTLLTDGIEPTDDPILQLRRGVYEASAAYRTGGWRSGPLSRTSL